MPEFEYRACVGDVGEPMEDWEGPFATRQEAEARLPMMQGDPEYGRMWIEKRQVGDWTHVHEMTVAPLAGRQGRDA